MKTALVIWSGISGLSIACYLAKAGYKVQLYEKNNQLWWRSGLFQEAWYTFDMWPSWYLMPEVFESFFSYFWKKTSDYYKSEKLDPAYRIFFSDQDFVDISTKLEDNIQLFESLEPWAWERLIEYISIAKEEYEVAIGSLIQKNYDSFSDLFSLKGLRFIAKFKNFISYESYVRKYFSSPKLQKILLYTSVFLGWSPKNTPALYSLINHCDFNDGVYFPKGWIYSLVQAFVSLAEELWVEMYTNREVKKIMIKDGRALWIELESWEILWSIVVSSGDYHYADQVLIDPKYRQYTQKQWDSMTLSPSGFILYLGIHKKIPALEHHTLFFDPDWDNHFNSIYKDKTLCETPSYYVSCVSKTDPTVAPTWCEAVFIFVPTAPWLKLSEWEKNEYADKIISGLSRAIWEDLAWYIDMRRIYTGDDFSKDYFAFWGNALGLAHTFRQTLTLRPKNKHPKVSWLYFTGHYTTPGTGMPMVLISSKLVKDKILAD